MTDENSASVLERKTPPKIGVPKSTLGEDKITYIPGPQDPVETTVGGDGTLDADGNPTGIRFKANIPQQIARNVTSMVLIRDERENADGMIVSRSVERRVPLVDLLRDNPCFSINDEPPRVREVGGNRLPTDPDQYRGYAYDWIGRESNERNLRLRWQGEEAIRNRLGVTVEDMRQLIPFYQGKLLSLGGAKEVEALPR